MSESGNGRIFKTLHIDSGLGWRGGQNQVYLLCRGLLRRGHAVTLVSPPNSELSKRLAPPGARLKPPGARIFPVSQRGDLDWPAAQRLRRILETTQPDLIQAHTAHAHAVAVLAVGRNGRWPVFVSRRVDFAIGGNFISRRKYFHPACRYLAISEAVAEVLKRGGIDEERIRIVPSGVDPEKFRAVHDGSRLRRELALPEATFVVGTVGALVDHKDHETLIRAARLVAERDPQVIFLIVGWGERFRRLYRLIDELDARRYVRLLGFRRDVEACLAGFDLYAVSSHMEGLCTSIIDAMLMGVPVVATRAGGIPELVRDGETGRLVPKRDPAALADAILALKADAEQRRRLARNGERLALNHFTAEQMVEKTLEAYAHFLPGR